MRRHRRGHLGAGAACILLVATWMTARLQPLALVMCVAGAGQTQMGLIRRSQLLQGLQHQRVINRYSSGKMPGKTFELAGNCLAGWQPKVLRSRLEGKWKAISGSLRVMRIHHVTDCNYKVTPCATQP